MLLRYGFVLVICLAGAVVAIAAPKSKEAPEKAASTEKADAPEADASNGAGEADEFTTLFRQWKELVAKMQRLRRQYQTDPAADKQGLEAEAKKTTDAAHDLLPALIAAAEKSYVASPNKDKELSDFLLRCLGDYVGKDNYEKAAALAKVMVANNFEDKQLNLLAGLAFFGDNDFDDAGKYLQLAKAANAINQIGLQDLSQIPKYEQAWAREQKIREAEDQADDLPKVKITTTKGDITILLLENEAPNATANFISLVEKGFYDGTPFHRVIPGFMAQGGDPQGNGTGGPGYTIPCECYQDNHRIHFRGSLSMAHAGKDTGGSQFFLTFLPTAHLDGKHTVFGRVVDGFDVLSKLQRTEPASANSQGKPDKIVKATVLRKRKHKYDPLKRLDKR